MPEIEIAGRTFAVDEEGFLQQPELWDDEVAKLFATTEGIGAMTPEHWAVVRMIREYYLRARHGPDGTAALPEDRPPPEEHLQAVPVGPRQGGVQGRRPAQTRGVRLKRRTG